MRKLFILKKCTKTSWIRLIWNTKQHCTWLKGFWNMWDKRNCFISPKAYLKMCLLTPLRSLPDLFWVLIIWFIYWEHVIYKKTVRHRGLRYLRYRPNLCLRGAQTHVTSILQTLNWVLSHSEMWPEHSRPQDTPLVHTTPVTRASLLFLEHFTILQLAVSCLQCSPHFFQCLFKSHLLGSLTKIQLPICHLILLSLLYFFSSGCYHFLNSYHPCLFFISHTRKWAPQR